MTVNVPPYVNKALPNPPPLIGGTPFYFLIPYDTLRDVDPFTQLTVSLFVNISDVWVPSTNLSWIQIDPVTRWVNGTAPSSGAFTVMIIATDPSGSAVNSTFQLVVNSPPVAIRTPSPVQAIVGIPMSVTIDNTYFRTFNGDQLLLQPLQNNKASLVSWFSWTYDGATQSLHLFGVPLQSDLGSLSFRIYGGNALTPLAAYVPMTVSVRGMAPLRPPPPSPAPAPSVCGRT